MEVKRNQQRKGNGRMADTKTRGSEKVAVERDLWPDADLYKQNEMPAPRSVLKQQASFFARHMKNVLTADVESSLPEDGSFRTYHNFWIVAPFLGERRYKLFYARHESQLYPVVLVWAQDDTEFRKCETPDEMRDALTELFRDPRTVEAIRGMLVDSAAASSD